MTRALLIVTAVLEATTGLALLVSPSVPVSLLLGASLAGPTAWSVARIAGAALVAFATGCWLARDDTGSAAGKGLVVAALLYNVVASVILGHAGSIAGWRGVGLWLALALHGTLATWCVVSLAASRRMA